MTDTSSQIGGDAGDTGSAGDGDIGGSASMDDTLDAVFDEIAAKDDDDAGDEGSTGEDKGASEDTSDDDDTGGDDDDDDSPDQPGEDDSDDSEDAPASKSDAPPGWSNPMKELFSTLPEEARDYISGREKASHAQLSEQGRVISTLRPVYDTVVKYQHTFEGRGLDPNAAISGLFEAQDLLDRDPMGGIQEIARIYGVDLTGTTQPQDQGEQDPGTAALRGEVLSLRNQLSSIANEAANERQSRVQTMNDNTLREVAEWSNDKPHFEQVRQQMAGLINAGVASDLDSAYDAACKLDPTIVEKIADDQRAMNKKMETVRAAKAVKEAKRRSRVGTHRQTDHVKKTGSWEETMDEVADGIM